MTQVAEFGRYALFFQLSRPLQFTTELFTMS